MGVILNTCIKGPCSAAREHCLIYGQFSTAILDFQKFEILPVLPTRRPNLHHYAKFHAVRSNRCRDMPVFQFIKMLAIRSLGFSKVRNFNSPSDLESQNVSLCQISLQSVKLLWRYGRISIFGFFEFRADQPNRCIFRLFQMAAVCHIGFVVRLSGPPTKSIWWSSLCKTWFKLVQCFRQYASFSILRVKLENA